MTRLSKLIEQQALYAFSGDVDEIRRNYDLMLDFMRRGYTDERRNDLYDEMIGKTYRLIQNIQVELKKKDNPSYHDAAYRLTSSRIDFDPDAIRQRLEDHVADKLADVGTHQGVFGIFRTPVHTLDEAKTGGRYLALERVQDPGNVAALCRRVRL